MSHSSVPSVECVILVSSEFSIQNDVFMAFCLWLGICVLIAAVVGLWLWIAVVMGCILSMRISMRLVIFVELLGASLRSPAVSCDCKDVV